MLISIPHPHRLASQFLYQSTGDKSADKIKNYSLSRGYIHPLGIFGGQYLLIVLYQSFRTIG
jgi:hypothetical protein